VSAPVALRVESIATKFTSQYHVGQVISIPVAHGDGRYTADGDTLARLEGDGHVEWFEGNFDAYEEDKKRRLGVESLILHRIKSQKFGR
jgi:phosphoribosylformylglycinamidine (FGAM) synthase-like amidotransferase family enzyme